MSIHLKQESNYGGRYTDSKTGYTTGYYTLKQMKTLYPQGGYRVAGGIGKIKEGQYTVAQRLEDSEGHQISVYRGSEFKGLINSVVGYARVDDDVFVAVVGKRSHKTLVLALLGVALLAAAVYCALNWNTWFPQKLDIDPSAAAVPTQNVPQRENINIPGYTVITANTDGKTKWNLVNPEGNPCYFQVVVKTKDRNRVIYESKLMPPGSEIKDPELTRKLSPGTYDITLQYNTFELEGDHAPMNNAVTEAQLVVE
ncbi:hypothetical protein SAMN04515624_1253 [Eubacterium maltosivorans]|uniref:hypothetical protein n=1 Tax=Eubacterium TaxID=1730 RepID=UPI00088E2509|nr:MULTISPECIES: hypothetical protein [Eubacterium]MDO5434333.1 hypothetical protein [Eubacterium sp.]WPK81853.1 hypothetical protein EUMA32_33100 [Eubacterium maltosivorans]SDP72339.1 hypothetical protein SAMN04515624_1253 [Eubacterium maltosivorans]